MKKDQIIKTLLWCAVAFWMALIFCFSAQDADASLETSDGVLDLVIRCFYPDFDSLSPAEQAAKCENLSFYIRKAAHFSVFGVLGALTSLAVSRHTASLRLTSEISAVICVLYAVSDEIHQYFVPGRACMLFDVCVDSAGCFLGIAILTLILFSVRKRKYSKG